MLCEVDFKNVLFFIEHFEELGGRNKNHSEGKNVLINGEAYEVYINTINIEKEAIGKLNLIYNTNETWMRSGNPGSIKDPISFVGNLVSRQAICYNVGYIRVNKWSYREENNEDIEFRETAAHEIGHEILKKYGGTFYSYGHKGSVNSITQSSNDHATKYPTSGEIDIMPYYTNWIPYSERKRLVASDVDVKSLLWLTKIQIK